MEQAHREKAHKQAEDLALVLVISHGLAEGAVDADKEWVAVRVVATHNMSPRPRMRRRIGFSPNVTFFKPQGVPMRQLEIIELVPEELEAIRLTQYKGLSQTEAAEKMQTSQSTLQRIFSSGLSKIAEALIEGKAIRLEE